MSCVIGPLMILTRETHARLLTDLVKTRVEYEDAICRALTAEEQAARLNRMIRQQIDLINVLYEHNSQLRRAVHDADVLLGLAE